MAEDINISEFNGAQLKLFRINDILNNIRECRQTFDLKTWLSSLKDFDMELEAVKTEEEKKIYTKEIQILSDKINSTLGILHNPRIPSRLKTIPAEIIDSLDNFHKKLLGIYKRSGLEMKFSGTAMTNFGK